MKSLIAVVLTLIVVTVENSSALVGGQVAVKGQFPYSAALRIEVGDRTELCSGTLISQLDVLTAARCCDLADTVEVILGVVRIDTAFDPDRVSFNVPRANIRIHPQWNRLTLQNDICMLRLPSIVQFTEFINLANLPVDDADDLERTRERVLALSWRSVLNVTTPTISAELQYGSFKVIPLSVCRTISNTQICTRGTVLGGTLAWNIGSGGALVNIDGAITTILGVFSYPVPFFTQLAPSVFTRVSSFISWIQQNMV